MAVGPPLWRVSTRKMRLAIPPPQDALGKIEEISSAAAASAQTYSAKNIYYTATAATATAMSIKIMRLPACVALFVGAKVQQKEREILLGPLKQLKGG